MPPLSFEALTLKLVFLFFRCVTLIDLDLFPLLLLAPTVVLVLLPWYVTLTDLSPDPLFFLCAVAEAVTLPKFLVTVPPTFSLETEGVALHFLDLAEGSGISVVDVIPWITFLLPTFLVAIT